jgi:hypothetical protein
MVAARVSKDLYQTKCTAVFEHVYELPGEEECVFGEHSFSSRCKNATAQKSVICRKCILLFDSAIVKLINWPAGKRKQAELKVTVSKMETIRWLIGSVEQEMIVNYRITR